ncbi:hypothetical protein RM780_11780 [Streptomyces sp. DSM 44917]|uniref:Uncharacterized protein n=1 Tax=Streptomyces boetiae TaxID=3075541 RepID=A0ABU2L7U5_9ACTN|nr:hypothetical protein [Streptomyces sp. DSM 44917]MDT0307639.1 hypothetical protein [Streptomyces sp. DSM 44917]
MDDVLRLVLRGLKAVGKAVYVFLEFVNLRDGLRGLRRDARRARRLRKE